MRQIKVCPRCKKEHSIEAVVCSDCRTRLGAIVTAAEPIPQGSAIPTQPADSTEGLKVCRQNGTKRITLQLRHESTGRVFEIPPNELFGRESIRHGDKIDDLDTISRKHCTFLFEQNGCFLRDENSTNGTSLNEIPCAPGKKYPLTMGSIVTLGDQKFIVDKLEA